MSGFDPDDDEDGIRKLFVYVVIQIFEDATTQSPNHITNANDIRLARSFLTTQSRDMIDICDLAGLSPVSVYKIAEKVKQNGWKRIPGMRMLKW